MAFAQLTMRSVVLDMEVKVDVIIPQDRKHYEPLPDKKYKVLYVLHGYNEDNSSWMLNSNMHLIARDYDIFVVFVAGYNSFYINSPYGMAMEKYLTEELPVRLRNIFPISDKREDTYIMGESMGGYGTFRMALAHPDLYSKAVPLSGSNFLKGRSNARPITSYDPTAPDEMYEILDLHPLLEKFKDSTIKAPEIFLMCGTEDPGYQRCLNLAKEIKEEYPLISFKDEYWPGKHDYFFWNEAIPKAFEFFGYELGTDKERLKYRP